MNTQPSLFQMPTAITLLEFNGRIKRLLNSDEVQNCWIQAETSDLRVSTHCYLELIQKNEKGDTVARMGAVIWANAFRSLNAKFHSVTGQDITTGLNVMVCVSVSYNEKFGLKAIISDINPEFTLGDMVRQRMEIIKRLTQENLIDLNKSVLLSVAPQQIAVISAAGAAGYGDFINQLKNNAYGVVFYPCLFSAMMQGADTAQSVMSAIDRIEENAHLFHCIVIIRGGGSSSDLNSFDNYDIAARIARCKLHVIVGIGHERDTTVLDYVAGTRVKTPTAAAEFLIQRCATQLAILSEMASAISSTVKETLIRSREQMAHYTDIIPLAARKKLEAEHLKLQNASATIPVCVRSRLQGEKTMREHNVEKLSIAVRQNIAMQKTWQQNVAEKLEILSPRNTLNRGFALVMRNGAFVTDAKSLKEGENITVHLKNGRIRTKITEVVGKT
ncbi:MAG: exodeoxyribonuclease VII large subunit [Muribaculaceae bacterium]|nr:exodeoxyribonuclease VII large subunit [Muribaculaceae bacterium]